MTFRDRFLRKIPDELLKLVLAIDVTFLLLVGFSYPYIDRGSATYVVFVLTLVPLCAMLAGTLLLLHYKPSDAIPELE